MDAGWETRRPEGTDTQRLLQVCEAPESLDVLLQRIVEGETLETLARAWAVPVGRLRLWVTEEPERLRRYEAAQALAAEARMDEVLGLADRCDETSKTAVVKARLQIETRFRLAACHKAERYGRERESSPRTQLTVLVQRAVPPPPQELAHDQTAVSTESDR